MKKVSPVMSILQCRSPCHLHHHCQVENRQNVLNAVCLKICVGQDNEAIVWILPIASLIPQVPQGAHYSNPAPNSSNIGGYCRFCLVPSQMSEVCTIFHPNVRVAAL